MLKTLLAILISATIGITHLHAESFTYSVRASTPEDAQFMAELSQIGSFQYMYTSYNYGITHPTDAYFELAYDKIKCVPGKEESKEQQKFWHITHEFMKGFAFISTLAGIAMMSDHLKKGISPLPTLTHITVPLGFFLYARSVNSRLCDDWQIIPRCLGIEPRKVLKEEFWFLYPPGSRLRYVVSSSFLADFSLMILGGIASVFSLAMLDEVLIKPKNQKQ